MKPRWRGFFFTLLLSLVFFPFSFSDWHILIRGSWLPITCFQSHFSVCSWGPHSVLHRVGWWEGIRRKNRCGEIDRSLRGNLVKRSAWLLSKPNKTMWICSLRATLRNRFWPRVANYWCLCRLCHQLYEDWLKCCLQKAWHCFFPCLPPLILYYLSFMQSKVGHCQKDSWFTPIHVSGELLAIGFFILIFF